MQSPIRRWVMRFGRRPRLLACLFICVITSAGNAWQRQPTAPQWIWHPDHQAGHVPQTECFFRKSLRLRNVKKAQLAIAADDAYVVYVNGQQVHSGTSTDGIATVEITSHIEDGQNVIAVQVTNRNGNTAGLVARIEIVDTSNRSRIYVTDDSWKTSLNVTVLWTRTIYLDRRWPAAKQLGPLANFIELQRKTIAAKTDGRRKPSKAEAQSNDTTSHQPLARNSQPKAKPQTGNATPVPHAPLTRQPASGSQLEVPHDFQVQQLAGHADVGSLTAMTFNGQGQLVVAREDGQLWLLIDADGDGVVDTRKDYGHLLSTCQGILSLGNALYVTGKGPSGLALYRLTDEDGDDRLDSVQPIVPFGGDNLEHGPHGIILGPDGRLYVVVGNDSPLPESVRDGSPYHTSYEGDLVQPRFQDPAGHAVDTTAPGGYILRTDLSGQDVQIVAGGLRNAYDLAFNHNGALFVHDSDMESDRGTTWYRPTRLYQVIDGAEFGWRSGWAKWPEYYPDALPGLVDTGRGSPTGIVAYTHRAFPTAYHDTLFSADWSEGQVYVIPCREKEGQLVARAKPFLRGKPLNVTDLDVGPDGALYLITGGRKTAGNVYRVHWSGDPAQSASTEDRGIDRVVRHPQLNSSWARQQIAAIKKQMGSDWPALLRQAAQDAQRSDAERIQALQVMHWFGPQPSVALLSELAGDVQPVVRRKAALLLGLYPDPASGQRLAQLLSDPDALVRRRACEALARGDHPVEIDRLEKLIASRNRFESWAARQLLEKQIARDATLVSDLIASDDTRVVLVAAIAGLRAHASRDLAKSVLDRSLELMEGFVSDRDFVDLLRVQQLALIRGQLGPEDVPKLSKRLALEYPSSSDTINRELVRLLVYLQVDSVLPRYMEQLARLADDGESSAETIHLAMHLTLLDADWSSDDKMRLLHFLASPPDAGASLPGYLQNASSRFSKQFSPAELLTALGHGTDNPGSALAALLQLPELLPGKQLDAVIQLDQRLAEYQTAAHRRLKVGIVAVLGRDGRPRATEYLRTIFDRDPERRPEVAVSLAATDDPDNWAYLVRSLSVVDAEDAREIVAKLKTIRRWPKEPEPYRAVLMAAERMQSAGADEAVSLLEFWQGVQPNSGKPDWRRRLKAWKTWYTSEFPQAEPPEQPVSVKGRHWDTAMLLGYLQRAQRNKTGSPERGKNVFVKAKCINCHRFGSKGESMGPDLTSVGNRFRTHELLESILSPSKVISDQYVAKNVITQDGAVYSGVVTKGVGNEWVVLQSNGKKQRLQADEIDEIEPSRISAMPEGLLDPLSLQEITDLFAYLMDAPQPRMTQSKSATKR